MEEEKKVITMNEIEAKDKKILDAILKKYNYELIAGKPPKKKPLWFKPLDTIYEYLKQPIIAGYFSREIEKFQIFKSTDALELAKIILFLGRVLNVNFKQEYAVRMEYDIKGFTHKCKIEKNLSFILKMYQAAQKLLKEEKCLSFIGLENDDMEFSRQEIKFIINELEKKPKTDTQELGNSANTLQFRFKMIGLLSNVGTKGKGIVKELAFLYDYINELIKGNDTSTLSNKVKSDTIKNAINSYLKWKIKTARPEDEDAFNDIEMWEK